MKYLQLGAAGCAMVVAGAFSAILLFVTQSWTSPENIVESEAQSIFVVPYLTGIAAWHDAGIWPNRPLEHAVNPLPRCKIGLRGYYSIRV